MNRQYHPVAAASPEDTDKELAQTYTQIVSSLDTHIAALQRERETQHIVQKPYTDILISTAQQCCVVLCCAVYIYI